MAKKKKKSKRNKRSLAPGTSSSLPPSGATANAPDPDLSAREVASGATGVSESAERGATPGDAERSPEWNALDPDVREKFASRYEPTWKMASEGAEWRSGKLALAAKRAPENEPEHRADPVAPVGESSFDSIPLPPLPRTKPHRTSIGVAVLMVALVLAGLVAASLSDDAPAPASTASPPEAAQGH